ncbi:gamma subclass chorismate mutase AroQ [Halomonas eurihalina]|nr:gamma subclass chorismate mutase AroQ [Halomonas eurihalina]MDR5859397.1 gamma subclass chorismate mutase AroQ [Halomonas eurihalina]
MNRALLGTGRLGLRHLGWITAGLLISGFVVAADQQASDEAQETVDGLIAQVEQRLSIAPDVAMAKWNSEAPINVPEREAQILKQVVEEAQHQGVDHQLARAFFQDQFDASKAVQKQLHQQWQKESQPPFGNPPNLANDIRPQLDTLTPQLIQSLSEFQTFETESAAQQYLEESAARAVANNEYAEALEIALSSLRDE